MKILASKVSEELRSLAKPKKAEIYRSFFKTGKGEYGEGDKFLGITVPETRRVSKRYRNLPEKEVEKLLASPFHEERLAALLIWVDQYELGDSKSKKHIFDVYLKNTKEINNWDLVDLSAYKIVGEEIASWPKTKRINFLRRLASSKNLWERRIAVVSTFALIKRQENEEIFFLADILMKDAHDLMHKAMGWMLRESGKKCGEEKLKHFLKNRYNKMPRTMLRYAIEKFDAETRKRYLLGTA